MDHCERPETLSRQQGSEDWIISDRLSSRGPRGLTEEEQWKSSERRIVLGRPEVGRDKVLGKTDSMGVPISSAIVEQEGYLRSGTGSQR